MHREFERALISWQRYQDAEPWRRIDGDDIFGIDDERTGQSWYASILGQQGTVYGLAMHRGEEGLQVVGGLIEQDVDYDQAATTSTSLCISRNDGPIPIWYRDFLKESLGRKKGLARLPLLYLNEGTRRPRPPNADEIRLLADAMDAIAALVARAALKPAGFEPGRPMPCVRLRTDGTFDVGEKTPAFRPPQVERYQLPADRRDAIGKLPRLDEADIVSCSIGNLTVQERKVRVLIVIHQDGDLVLAVEAVEVNDREAMAKCLLGVYEGRNTARRIGVPREIQTDSRFFYETFKEALGEIGIRVVCVEHIPVLERFRQSLADFLDRPPEKG